MRRGNIGWFKFALTVLYKLRHLIFALEGRSLLLDHGLNDGIMLTKENTVPCSERVVRGFAVESDWKRSGMDPYVSNNYEYNRKFFKRFTISTNSSEFIEEVRRMPF